MIYRALTFLSTEIRGLHAAAYILAASSLLSSLLALFRDRLLAHIFGAGPQLDVYFAAFRIPDFVFIAIGALVSAYMLIPELTKRTEEERYRYIDTILFGYSVLVILVAGGAAIAAPFLITHLFPALVANGNLEILTLLTRILLLQAILLGFSNIAAALTQYRHRYTLYAFSPIVYNVGIIMGAIVLYPTFGLPGLVWGVVAGAFLHVGIQVPAIWRDGYLRALPRIRESGAFLATVTLSLPRALALSMNQVAFLGLISLAATLASGSIAVFTFAYNLYSVPLAVIGASYATAAFPTLAAAFSRGQSEEFMAQVGSAARQILFWSLPTIALVIVLRAHIVRAVLGSGEFDWTDTRLTAAALALFTLGLAAQGIWLLLVRACYAAGRTFAPFIVSCVGAGLTILLGFIFLSILEHSTQTSTVEGLLRVQDLIGTHVLALPLAYATATIIASLFLILYFESLCRGFFADIARSFRQGIVAATAGGVGAYAALHLIGDITFSSTLGSVLFRAGVAGGAGLFVTALAYFLLKNREFAENVEALRRRLWRDAEPVASGEQSV